MFALKMKMKDFIKITIVFAILVSLDLVYLGVIQKEFITRFFTTINRGPMKLQLVPGLLSWALLAWGLYHFVLSRPRWTLIDAALFGLIVYGVYDMTNLATIAGWTWQFAVADMIWGAVLMTIVALIFRSVPKGITR